MIESQIRENKLKVYIYMFALTMIIVLLGSALSFAFKWGLTGTGYFLIAAGIINFIAYFYSHKLILLTVRAKQLKEDQAPEIFQIVRNLAEKMNIPLPKIYLVEDDTMNAFATGRNYKNAIVGITRGLVQRLSKDELEGVIAHELAHIQNYDMRTMAIISILAGFISLIADLYWRSSLISSAREKESSGFIEIIGLILSVFAPITAFFIQLAISRKREFIADAQAAQNTNNPKALASALKKISMDIRLPKHFSASTAHIYFSLPSSSSWFEKLFSTHPPIEERIYILENFKL